MKKYQPSKISLISLKIIFLILLIGIIVALNIFLDFVPIVKEIASIALILIYLFTFFIYLPLFYKRTTYIISKSEITINSGVFIISKKIINSNSLVYLTRLRLPLSNLCKWEIIIVNALGSSLFIPFLSKSDADEIYSTLSSQIETAKEN